jgi:23S rRNA pseudouridine2605 synthase
MKPDSAGTSRPSAEAAKERLQKIMATAGLGSRRSIEKQIAAGTVRLNGAVAELGATAGTGDIIQMADQRWRVVEKPVRFRTLIYNKPEGEVTTRSDPEGRPTVFDRLPRLQNQRWISVGRLDINTSGLLLLTTDGELANAMMHPSGNVDREYACRIHGQVTQQQLERLKSGVELEDGMAHFSDIQAVGAESEPGEGGGSSNRWFHVVLMEGRNREVRRLWQSQGLDVSRLKRVRYGGAFLPKHMHVGKWREIEQDEHTVLREDVGLPSATSILSVDPIAAPKKPTRARGAMKPRR